MQSVKCRAYVLCLKHERKTDQLTQNCAGALPWHAGTANASLSGAHAYTCRTCMAGGLACARTNAKYTSDLFMIVLHQCSPLALLPLNPIQMRIGAHDIDSDCPSGTQDMSLYRTVQDMYIMNNRTRIRNIFTGHVTVQCPEDTCITQAVGHQKMANLFRKDR